MLPIQAAVVECYTDAVRLIPLKLRKSFILVGGAANIAHGLEHRTTEDADIAITPTALAAFLDAVNDADTQFRADTYGRVEYASPRGFSINIEFLELGGAYVPQLVAPLVPLGEGYVASLEDLARLRGATVMQRGEDKDITDFGKVLGAMVQKGRRFGHLAEEEMRVLVAAAEKLDGVGQQHFMTLLTTYDFKGERKGDFTPWLPYGTPISIPIAP